MILLIMNLEASFFVIFEYKDRNSNKELIIKYLCFVINYVKFAFQTTTLISTLYIYSLNERFVI